MLQVNLQQLYGRTFGFGFTSGLPFAPIDTKTEATGAKPFDTWEDNEDQATEFGPYGTPIQLPCKLEDFQLPNEPLISFRQTKNIVITPIDGNNGTFKEHYSNGDMQVVIRGICVDLEKPDSYPEQQVRALRNLLEERKHLRIVNRLTAMWNIEHIAVVDFDFAAVPGEIGMQRYEINCLSDREYQLRLKD